LLVLLSGRAVVLDGLDEADGTLVIDGFLQVLFALCSQQVVTDLTRQKIRRTPNPTS
jgi:hypothetical protein